MSATTRYAAMSRRAAMTAAALTAMVAMAGCNSGGAGAPADGDMAMGAPEGAKVTVVEYASVTCHVCEAWQKENWEAFKAAYVDTNKVRYVFREIPTPPAEIAVAGFLVARCAGEGKYFDVVHELLASREEFVTDPRSTLFRVGNGAGLSNDQVQQCITNEAAQIAAEERAQAARSAGVDSTPTFLVNGTKVITPGSPSGPSMDDLSKAIDAELAKN
ncbi:MAG: thioredoxin domain-containing protein [Brevundimonas sp.]|uniref:thioredoxin domain-containing protein n=1 Tax=Brevundimonas sp. TaxID=1871086 RepID=UPI002AB8BED8|nr:thioredoxin domain-containing protein [Brevundimonas sp.]MDZ4114318.1 thioredoxin domain-containing protein [Brevundimonas sp.]